MASASWIWLLANNALTIVAALMKGFRVYIGSTPGSRCLLELSFTSSAERTTVLFICVANCHNSLQLGLVCGISGMIVERCRAQVRALHHGVNHFVIHQQKSTRRSWELYVPFLLI